MTYVLLFTLAFSVGWNVSLTLDIIKLRKTIRHVRLRLRDALLNPVERVPRGQGFSQMPGKEPKPPGDPYRTSGKVRPPKSDFDFNYVNPEPWAKCTVCGDEVIGMRGNAQHGSCVEDVPKPHFDPDPMPVDRKPVLIATYHEKIETSKKALAKFHQTDGAIASMWYDRYQTASREACDKAKELFSLGYDVLDEDESE